MTYIFHIHRQERPRSRAYWQDFSYDGQPGDSVAQALMAINEDSPLQDRNGQDTAPIRWQRSCLVRKCGACAMVINGVPSLACSTFLSALSGPVITLEPLSLFPVVADLIVDRSFLYDRLKDWQIWLDQPAAASPWTWKNRYESARCLLCGCCLEVCHNASPQSLFAGAAAAVQAYRILSQETGDSPHGRQLRQAYRHQYFEHCGQSMACQEVCPARLAVTDLLACANSLVLWKHSRW